MILYFLERSDVHFIAIFPPGEQLKIEFYDFCDLLVTMRFRIYYKNVGNGIFKYNK